MVGLFEGVWGTVGCKFELTQVMLFFMVLCLPVGLLLLSIIGTLRFLCYEKEVL